MFKRLGLKLIRKSLSAWTNKVMHIDNTTSNRYAIIFQLILCVICNVEQAHGNVKRILQTSMGDLCICWDAINNFLVLQHNEIKASFEMSLYIFTHTFNRSLFIGYGKQVCVGAHCIRV